MRLFRDKTRENDWTTTTSTQKFEKYYASSIIQYLGIFFDGGLLKFGYSGILFLNCETFNT